MPTRTGWWRCITTPRTPGTFGYGIDPGEIVRYAVFDMKTTLSVSKGHAIFPAVCRRKETTPITRNGEVVAFVVPRARMQLLLEQMEILANPEAMKAVRRARAGKAKDHPLTALDES